MNKISGVILSMALRVVSAAQKVVHGAVQIIGDFGEAVKGNGFSVIHVGQRIFP